METSNKRYREKLVQQIKDAGEELIKRSDCDRLCKKEV